jgi:uncharacterized protein YbjT (DUF2867 family)
MIQNRTVTVFGAYGHTGRFVVSELHKRRFTPILSGRDATKLKEAGNAHPESEVRVATVDDCASLDRALSGAVAVINVAAEQASVLTVFERFANAAQNAGVVVAPAMGFYGGLGDLLATAAMGEWDAADEICIAIALDSWKPTRGTRLTGQRNPGPPREPF